MCGICGLVYRGRERPVDLSQLRRMCETLIPRGPDDDGYYVKNNVGMAMRRLSIIDLQSGRQPIHNEDQTVWVTLNGEIYNFLELTESLQKLGHHFYTKTDTEVIVHLYEEYGDGFVEHLNGMFGICLWDSNQEKLILVRDRLGIKPLYYYADGEKFMWGSELKAIVADSSVPRDVSAIGLDNYFHWGYIPAPYSIYQHIHKLQPGHLLVYRTGHIRIESYWDFPPYTHQHTDGDISEQIIALLQDSVKRRMIADVPLGAFLSGGIDSSTVVALMTLSADQPVRTFSARFLEDRYDEGSYARQVSDYLGTEHCEFVLEPGRENIIPDVLPYLDEPLADTAVLPTYYIAKLAREHVTVILTGDGADELFAGYSKYRLLRAIELYRRVPKTLRKVVSGFVSLLPARHLGRMEKQVSEGAALTPVDAFLSVNAMFDPTLRQQIYSRDFQQELAKVAPTKTNLMSDYFSDYATMDYLNRCLYVDAKLGLAEGMLVKVDRTTMANSLEARVPFLDHRLVELITMLPSSLKLRHFRSKDILKRSVAHLLPQHIIHRKKHPFNVPIGTWLGKDWNTYFADIFANPHSTIEMILDLGVAREILERHQAGQCDYSQQLWAILVLDVWLKTWL